VDTAFEQIRQAARSNPAVAIRMLEAIAELPDTCDARRAPDAACLQRHAGMIVAGAREAVPDANDRLAVEARFLVATEALRGLHTSREHGQSEMWNDLPSHRATERTR